MSLHDSHLCCRIQQHDEDQAEELDGSQPLLSGSKVDFGVGVLHYTPGQEPFPLLAQPAEYLPDTIDITDTAEMNYWIKILSGQTPIVAEKAIATDRTAGDLYILPAGKLSIFAYSQTFFIITVIIRPR